MKARVVVTLKRSVLDPQGQAVSHALASLGYGEVQGARLGKIIELDLDEKDPERARSRVTEMCERLLANTVIEEYRVESMTPLRQGSRGRRDDVRHRRLPRQQLRSRRLPRGQARPRPRRPLHLAQGQRPARRRLVVLPGGFSYGDYLRTGAIARFSPVMEEVRKFANRGGHVLGICNGFQILLEAGLLPGAMRRNDR